MAQHARRSESVESQGRMLYRTSLRVDADGTVELPPELRRILGLEAGDTFSVSLIDNGCLILRPTSARHDPEQWWFWTDDWQASERQVDEDRSRGEQGATFESTEAFLAHLDSLGGEGD
jgi:bifunctional DNA-binding transcriptional regulator/antitoxin component of YhaV-PrlF toxin-antitoxin module